MGVRSTDHRGDRVSVGTDSLAPLLEDRRRTREAKSIAMRTDPYAISEENRKFRQGQVVPDDPATQKPADPTDEAG